jgi:Predicted membrane protein (DUF2207)
MTSRLLLAALSALWAVSISAAPVKADEPWVITSFHSQITIHTDSSLAIQEHIEADFGSLTRHGIFRTIPIRYRYDATHDRYYNLRVVSVTNGTAPIPYTTALQGPDEVIKIGDPDRLVTGANTYVITYTVQGAMNAFPEHDELFWNVDGALWPVAKLSVSATVLLPSAAYQAAACYQGHTGSSESCQYGNTTQSVTYSSTRALAAGEQMSIVTGLNKGAVTVPPPLLEGRLRSFPQDAFDINPVTIGLSLLVLAGSIALIAWFWWEHGRDRAYLTQYYLTNDPRDQAEPVFKHEPVVVEFGPPQDLRPAQLGLMLDESADTKDVTATIVDLAVRGFLTIAEVPGQRDWILTRKEGEMSSLMPFERTLLDGLFANGRQQVKVSELRGTFRTTLQMVEGEVISDAMGRKLFRVRPDLMRGGAIGVGLLDILLGAGLTFLLGITFGGGLIGVAVILAGIVLLVFHRALSTRSAAGRDLMQHTLGFRLYMNTAEKYRQQFAEKAEIFTQLLPYAIVFGCVTRWAKAFEGIDTSPSNSWYLGNTPFQAALLSSNLESMNSSISSAISSAPPSSGSSSGFGGGSGGGGGGGGGGSW